MSIGKAKCKKAKKLFRSFHLFITAIKTSQHISMAR